MNALLAAISSKLSGSALSTDVGGRYRLDEAAQGWQMPYVIIRIVSGVPQDTFREDLEEALVRFSLFSSSKGTSEIGTMYADLIALMDDAALSITGYTCVWCKRENLAPMFEEVTTPEGTVGVRHWAVDYNILMQKS